MSEERESFKPLRPAKLPLPTVFPAIITDAATDADGFPVYTASSYSGLIPYSPLRNGMDAGDGVTPQMLPVDSEVLITRDPTLSGAWLFSTGGGGGAAPDYKMVIVKGNGGTAGNGTTPATFAYDLYNQSDSTYTTKLNLSGALQPTCGRARTITATIIAAPDGSLAQAGFNSSRIILLWDCQETYSQTNCTS